MVAHYPLKIWLITVGEPLPIDGNYARLWRTGLIAKMLANSGDSVTWWTSDFDHFSKRHRFGRHTTQIAGGIEYRLLHGCGYRKNISLSRQIDHLQIARQFAKQAKALQQPDIVLASLPTIELAYAAVNYGRQHSVPVVLDIRDLWPDIFAEEAPLIARPLARLALMPLEAVVNKACRGAAGITGNSEDFVAWGVRRAGRSRTMFDRVFPFGYPQLDTDDTTTKAYTAAWRARGVANDGYLTVCFFGSLSDRFDYETVLSAARLLLDRKSSVRFVLCGNGENLAKLREAAETTPNLIVPGWVNAAEIESLMRISQVGLAPYRNGVGFEGNVPNKPIEYASGRLATVSCLNGALAELIQKYDIGAQYESGRSASLVAVLETLEQNRDVLERKCNNARSLFERSYRAEAVYNEMIDYLRSIAGSSGPIEIRGAP
ncbi:glycosyltransferase family 4 protein [Bradyrhizobium sp. WSM471]|uniref:glycosyltransferase family 4 protein n=1 Tax=Bradyrhizobium sp. WSM471 TaxID=319017 RepID=UPI00024D2C1E|nr:MULTISPECIES: glycosyltransferase family 4 protein [Bradyrhizobium]EHR04617.1 glycosyltransferase [Bradyrhizobium sp. WSM471]UFW39767.1 glycosyltransferase family 4 protein [Bradyrhizobium canariense]